MGLICLCWSFQNVSHNKDIIQLLLILSPEMCICGFTCDVTHPKQRELCWCVALVVSAVALSLLPVMPGLGGGQPVVSDNPEKKTKFNKLLDYSMQAPKK